MKRQTKLRIRIIDVILEYFIATLCYTQGHKKLAIFWFIIGLIDTGITVYKYKEYDQEEKEEIRKGYINATEACNKKKSINEITKGKEVDK